MMELVVPGQFDSVRQLLVGGDEIDKVWVEGDCVHPIHWLGAVERTFAAAGYHRDYEPVDTRARSRPSCVSLLRETPAAAYVPTRRPWSNDLDVAGASIADAARVCVSVEAVMQGCRTTLQTWTARWLQNASTRVAALRDRNRDDLVAETTSLLRSALREPPSSRKPSSLSGAPWPRL